MNSLNKNISPGELALGQLITILEHDEVPERGNLMSFSDTLTMVRPSWGIGEVFRVEAIQLPFVVVSYHGYPSLDSRHLDTRAMRLMECSPEYVKALKKKS